MADEYTDISNKELLSLCFRWIDESLDVHKDFLGYYELPDIKSQTIVTAIKDSLIRMQLPLQDLRAQAYDGASNMFGKKSGVAVEILAEQPKDRNYFASEILSEKGNSSRKYQRPYFF